MTRTIARSAGVRAAMTRWLTAACFIIPAAVLAVMYLWLAADRGTLRLWDVVVHESGRYTLGRTVLYVAHVLREVPTDVAYAMFLLAAGGGRAADKPPRGSGRSALAWVGLGTAALVIVAALAATARANGWSSALWDLGQMRTRDDTVAYGSHWRYHWLSTIWFGAMVWLAPPLVCWLTGRPLIQRSRGWERAAWAYFLALTAVFGISGDVFMDTRYAGHQAREILTHGPVTTLLGLGVLLSVGRSRAVRDEPAPTGFAMQTWIRIGLAVGIPMYLAIVAVSGDVMSAGQSERGLAAMVGAHYFEHALDYLLVIMLVLGGLGLAAARRTGGPGSDDTALSARDTPR